MTQDPGPVLTNRIVICPGKQWVGFKVAAIRKAEKSFNQRDSMEARTGKGK
jgi:hypothetical protein